MDDDILALDDDAFEVTGSIGDLVAEMANENDDSARRYLRESWLAATIATLRRARWNAGLTQQAVAEKLNTTQSSVARLEKAEDTTLGRLWDYLDACGVAPSDIEPVPTSTLVKYVQERPQEARSAAAIRSWLSEDVPPAVANRATPATAVLDPLSIQEMVT